MIIPESGRLRRLFSLSAVATFIAIFAPHAWGQQCDATVGQGGNIQGVVSGELAGLDSDMGRSSSAYAFYFLDTDPVYADNAYYVYGPSAQYFAGPCGRQGSCITTAPSYFHKFSDWQSRITDGRGNYFDKQDLSSTIHQIGNSACTDR